MSKALELYKLAYKSFDEPKPDYSGFPDIRLCLMKAVAHPEWVCVRFGAKEIGQCLVRARWYYFFKNGVKEERPPRAGDWDYLVVDRWRGTGDKLMSLVGTQ